MALSSAKRGREGKEQGESVSSVSWQPHVLIVDNDHSSVLAVHGMASAFNWRVDAANGMEAALGCFEKSAYDAVITGYEMNGVTGDEFARWIRGRSPDTRIVAMTSREPAEIEPHLNAGIVDHWIFKPFGGDELLAVLGDLVPGTLTDSSVAG